MGGQQVWSTARAPAPAPKQVRAFGHRPVVYAILCLYALGSTILMAIHAVGVTSEHALLIVLVLFSLLAPARPFVWDWLPFLGIAVMFSDLGTLVSKASDGAHFLDPIVIERSLLGGNVAAVWLQQNLRMAAPWLDVPLATVYLTFFFSPTLFGIWLWIRQRAHFGTFVAAYSAVMGVGFFLYVLYPEAPPWIAARDGLLPHIDRITVTLLNNLGGFGRLYAGADPAPYGAMPALHVAVPALIAATMISIRGWRSSRTWLWLLYPATMVLATMYLGEHYFIDGAVGAAMGVLACVVATQAAIHHQRSSATVLPSPAAQLDCAS